MDVADGPIVPVTEKRCQLDVIGNVVLTMTAKVWSSISKFAEFVPEGVFTQQLKVKVWFATGMDGVTICPIKAPVPATEYATASAVAPPIGSVAALAVTAVL